MRQFGIVFVLFGMAACLATVGCGGSGNGQQPPTPQTCPSGEHWDADQGSCVAGCLEDSHCNDKNDCTQDSCDAATGTCSNESIANCGACATDVDCDDANVCTTDRCDAVTLHCAHDAVAGCCRQNADCDDADECTVDLCGTESGICAHQSIPDCTPSCKSDADCDDGNVCTTDTCNTQIHACLHALVPDCQTPCSSAADCQDGDDCTQDRCDPFTGLCVFDLLPDCRPCQTEQDCDDGDECTADICEAQYCRWAAIPSCGVACSIDEDCEDGDPCTADTCDSETAQCLSGEIIGCFVCTTDEDCPVGENPCEFAWCSDGFCAALDVLCDDGDLCTADRCEAGAGGCVFEAIPGCGTLCTNDLDCDDADLCTADRCDPASATCLHEPIAGCHPPCTDDSQCDDGDICTLDRCAPETGLCLHELIDGCGVACTDDADCDDGDACTDDRCDLQLGVCRNLMLPGCWPCETVADCPIPDDPCQSFACVDRLCQWQMLACDDLDPCTLDSCMAGQCTFEPLPDCRTCQATLDCLDGDPCTADECNAGVCQWSAIPDCHGCALDEDCADASPCSADRCDLDTRQCLHSPLPDGLPCDDGNLCTLADQCTAGACNGVAQLCEDDNLCTDDRCDPASGICLFEANFAACEDGDLCTVGDQCTAGQCQVGQLVQCNDGDVCTVDSCEPAAGCVFRFDSEQCPTPCQTQQDCAATPGAYCQKDAGACDGAGTCQAVPTTCPPTTDQVCGCDGVTYPNDCFAAAAGVNVRTEGVCAPIGCQDSSACGADEYCQKTAGQCEAAGQCVPLPTNCLPTWDPVCGCDGQDYSNACMAAAAGVNVRYLGPCVPNACYDNAACESAGTLQYCAKQAGACDGPGQCLARPAFCSPQILEVCGCDGQTYANACMAAAAGVNVKDFGVCQVACTQNSQCANGQYCAKDEGACDGQGVCTGLPAACTPLVDPVCGCDGVTYDNDCRAAQAGANIAYRGACFMAECQSNDDCPGFARYCAKQPGDCDGWGTCLVIPWDCQPIAEPVCGCDGESYHNECLAAQAGTNVAYTGECGVPGCVANSDCSSDLQFCLKDAGACLARGTCADLPTECPPLEAPVCGCDGQTYFNECLAWAGGQNVRYTGECQVNACKDNLDCDTWTQYCQKPAGDCEGIGTCVAIPDLCLPTSDPVCGCDGQTYINACFAAAVGVNVAQAGECTSMVCTLNSGCPSALYFCAKSAGACDGQGLCELRPTQCPSTWQPVCGCDGQTYMNECVANASGVTIDYDGECLLSQQCRENADCGADNLFCEKEWGVCDGIGRCAPYPQGCPWQWAPVCGCDGQTYANSCFANEAGINVDYDGQCEVTISCQLNSDCGSPQWFCQKAGGNCQGQGECVQRPACQPTPQDQPVCGCNNQTYDSECLAHRAGINVQYTGECAVVLDCHNNGDCQSALSYCAKPDGQCNGWGACEQRPLECPIEYVPVCGCNNQTYINDCMANQAGQNVRANGPCTN